MRIEPDDELYRVNAVWLGPEQFPFPWRATYRAYGIGLLIFTLLIGLTHQLIGIGHWWIVAFLFLVTIKLTQTVNARMGYERPFSAVAAMALREITAPRRPEQGRGLNAAARAVLQRAEDASPEFSEPPPGRAGQLWRLFHRHNTTTS